MDFRRPFQVITPSLDGDVLEVLAGTTAGLTGREIERLAGRSQDGVRKVLARLVEEGVVLQEPVGRAFRYSLNREHVAAPWIEGLAGLRAQLIGRLRERIESWEVRPSVAVLFGSAARGEAGTESDLDLLVIRPKRVDPDSDPWSGQITELASAATAWSGNDMRVLEYGEEELTRADEPVVREAAAEGISLYGAVETLLTAQTSMRRRRR